MNRSGIVALRDAIRAFFLANGDKVVVGRIGRSQRARVDNQAPHGAGRVLIITNDEDRGTLIRGKLAKGNPRVSFEWDQVVTLSVWAADPTNTSDEEAQIEASESLLERTLDAIEHAVDPVSGQAIGAGILTTPIKVREMATTNQNLYFGRELQLPITVKTLLYERPIPMVSPGAVPTFGFSDPGPITGSSAA